jgi:hypothetical protein
VTVHERGEMNDQPFVEDEFIGHLSDAANHIEIAIKLGRPARGNADLIAALNEIENAKAVLEDAIGTSDHVPSEPHDQE